MPNFSKSDRGAMEAAMRRLFKLDKQQLKTEAMQKWMNEAPVALVEYDGLLGNESAKQRDRRMEDHQVYNGDISKLAKNLRSVASREMESTPKWELIFFFYNEIMDVQRVITQAQEEIVFSETQANPVEVPQTEELPNSQSSSTEDAPAPQTEVQPEPADKVVPVMDNATAVAEDTKVEKPVVETKADAIAHEATHEKSITQEDTTPVPTGSVEAHTEQPYLNNNISKMEENKMDAVQNLMNAAQAPAAPAKEGVATKPQKVSVSKEDKEKVVSVLADTRAQRDEYTRGHQITGIISGSKPAALRALATTGTSFKKDDYADETKLQQKLTEKINGLLCKFTGKNNMTIEVFETLSDEEKFAQVKTDKDENAITKARAIYEIAKSVKQNPKQELPAHIPGASDVSYAVKGVVLEGQPFTMEELIVKILDNTTGGLYGVDSCDENGKAKKDATTFKVAVVTTSTKSNADSLANNKKPQRKLAIKIAHKKEFISGGDRVQYIFDQISSDGDSHASFRASIVINGKSEPANVTCYKVNENGERIISSDKMVKGERVVTYKTTPAFWSVSVPVSTVIREMGAQYKGAADAALDYSRWGLQMKAQKAAAGELVGAESVLGMVGFNAFAALLAGDVVLSDNIEGSEAVKALKAASNAAAAKEAAETEDALN